VDKENEKFDEGRCILLLHIPYDDQHFDLVLFMHFFNLLKSFTNYITAYD
jgi:hypothetical protein